MIAMQIPIRESTVEAPSSLVIYLMQNLRLRGRPPPIIFARIVRPMNALQLCRRHFSQETFSRISSIEVRF